MAKQAGIGDGGVFPSGGEVGGERSGERLFVLRAGVPRYVPFSSARRLSYPMGVGDFEQSGETHGE